MKNELINGVISREEFHNSQIHSYERKILNLDGETCWLNSVLQMIFIACDHSPSVIFQSTLGSQIQTAQTQVHIQSAPIKELLQRTVSDSQNVQHDIMRGLQCARDALIILTENRHAWYDVYNFLQHTTEQTITCLSCQSQSCTEMGQLYIEISPGNHQSIRGMLEKFYNQGENVECRCQVCGETGEFLKQIQIMTEQSSKYLIVQITRNETNYNSTISAVDDVTLIDSKNHPRSYTPLAIIHHSGGIDERLGYTQHYRCDIFNKDDQCWYTTSDALPAKKISKDEVSKAAFIMLFKRST